MIFLLASSAGHTEKKQTHAYFAFPYVFHQETLFALIRCDLALPWPDHHFMRFPLGNSERFKTHPLLGHFGAMDVTKTPDPDGTGRATANFLSNITVRSLPPNPWGPGKPRPQKSTSSGRPKNHVLKTQVYAKVIHPSCI